jgi:hypothetical protein
MTDLKNFDPKRRMVLAKAQQVNGFRLSQGCQITIVDEPTGGAGEITEGEAKLLFAQGTIINQDNAVATPVETPEQYATRATEVEPLGDGKHLIRAPWLPEGEIVPESKLAARVLEVIQQGADGHRERIAELGPDAAAAITSGTDGFVIADKGNGNFEISGPGLDETLKVRGRENAEAKLDELRTAHAQSQQIDKPEVVVPPGSAEVSQPGGQPVSDPAAKDETLELTDEKPKA